MIKLKSNIVFQIIFGVIIILSSCSQENKKHIVLKFDKGDDLVKGAQITLNGFGVGKIESVELDRYYQVCALVKIDRNINIPTDSKFVLDNESIFSTGIKVEPGESRNYLKNNDTVKGIIPESSKQEQIIEVFNDLIKNANSVKRQDSILTELKKLNSHLKDLSPKDTANTGLAIKP